MLTVTLYLALSTLEPRAWYLEMARLTMRGQTRRRRSWHEAGQDVAADGADEIDAGVGDDAGGLTLSEGGRLQGVVLSSQ